MNTIDNRINESKLQNSYISIQKSNNVVGNLKETFKPNTPATGAEQHHYTTSQQAKMPLTDYYLNKFDGGA